MISVMLLQVIPDRRFSVIGRSPELSANSIDASAIRASEILCALTISHPLVRSIKLKNLFVVFNDSCPGGLVVSGSRSLTGQSVFSILHFLLETVYKNCFILEPTRRKPYTIAYWVGLRMNSTTFAAIAIVSVLAFFGVVMVTVSVTMQLQEAEARG